MTIIGNHVSFKLNVKLMWEKKETDISFMFEKIKEMENNPLSDIWEFSWNNGKKSYDI